MIDPAAKPKKSKLRRFMRSLLNIAILLAIFWVGVKVGNGTITMTSATSSNKTLPENLDYREVERLYDVLKESYDGQLTVDKLTDGLKSGLVEATGDPYTEYLNTDDAKTFNQQLEGTFIGIGAQLGKDEDENIIVISPISGFPAEKAGLRARDVITTINGQPTEGMAIDEAVNKIRGKAGTEVKLDILRNKSEQKMFTIKRQEIKVPSVEKEILAGNVGYLKISQFSRDTAGLSEAAAQEFKQKRVKAVILDMRGNPGGLLPSAVEIASLWLPAGKTVLQEKRDNQVIETYQSTGRPVLNGVPTIVLIDEGSASASEIVAGALKDNGAARLVGVKSYGKGSVQQVLQLQNGAQIKVTVARWFRPNGQNIDKKGISPDIKVERNEKDFAAGRDPQRDRAVQELTR